MPRQRSTLLNKLHVELHSTEVQRIKKKLDGNIRVLESTVYRRVKMAVSEIHGPSNNG